MLASHVFHEAGHFVVASAVGGKNVRFYDFRTVKWDDGVDKKSEKFKVAIAGFTAQNLAAETFLSLQEKRKGKSYFVLGVLMGNFIEENFYRKGGVFNDVKTMDENSGLNETEIRLFLLVKSCLDLYRYYHPEQKWNVFITQLMTGTMVVGISVGF